MRVWVLLLLGMLLSSCSGAYLDRDQARLCRMTLPALLSAGTTVTIEAQTAVRSDGEGATVRIDDRATPPDGAPRHGFVECTFGTGDEKLKLHAVRLPGGPLSEPRVVMLQRFWLDTDDALAADPLPLPGADHAVPLPAGTGYALQQLVNAIPSAAVYGLLAAAYSLIYGLVGRINLAFGAFAAIGGAAALVPMLAGGDWPVAAMLACAVLAGLFAAGLHGIVAGRLVFARLHHATGQQGLVATIGLALFLDEYVRLAQGGRSRWAVPVLDQPYVIAADPTFTVTITPMAVLMALIAIGTAGGLLAAMRWLRFGREWRAFSDDPRAAALFGVGRDRIFATTFAIACALAGLAGCFTVLAYGELGLGYSTTLGVKALTAAVLGGIGSVPGAFLGGAFIGLTETAWSAAFPITHRDLVLFLILVACLIWRPGGFLGYRELTPRRV